MKPIHCLLPLLFASSLLAATNDLSTALQTGLFEEEANRNLPAAIAAYEKVAKQFDQNRALAATAIFRLGEVNRKLGKTNEAAAFYQRILREFTDQDTLAKLSQQNLAGMGVLPRTTGASSEATTANIGAINAAEAEAGKLEMEVKQLQAMKPDDLRRVAQQNYANPVLIKLLQDLATAEQQVVVVSKDFGSESPSVKSANELVKTIDKQIDAQLDGVLLALQVRRDAAVATAKALRERIGQSSTTQSSKSGDAPPITAVLDEEEAEIRRIQAMIQNSPDLINAPSTGLLTPLYRAAAAGQLRVARFLIENGADVNRRVVNSMPDAREKSWTPLHGAADNGHKAMTDLLLSKGAELKAADANGRTPLHLAAWKGFQSVVQALLANGADVNAKAKNGSTPLSLAVGEAHGATVTLLLNSGADPEIPREDGYGTPLIQAANLGHSEIVQRLLAGKANPQLANNGVTPLRCASESGHLEVVRILLAAKAGTDAEDNQGRTALSFAAEKGHVEIVTTLLAAKADPNAGKVNLPLHCAIKSKSAGIVEALLKAGADANRACNLSWGPSFARQSYGSITPLAVAMNEPQLDMVKLLLGNKADPNGKDVNGQPLIFFAVNDAEMMKALLDAGAKPNVDDGTVHRRSPLTMTSDSKIISLLLAAGANPETRHRQICDNSELGLTPLQIQAACGGKPVPASEALLKGGANVNARTSVGLTALHFAAANKNKELMELLLAYKADVNARDDQGLTPLDYAEGKAQPTASSSGTLRLSAQQPIQGSVTLSGNTTPHSETSNVAELLRQHGGRADLPKLDRIEVTRLETGYRETAFMADTNGWNRFTLLEVVQAFYEQQGPPNANPSLPFPDLTRLVVHRPSRTPGGKEQAIPVNLHNRTNGVDCAKDMPLEFGDTVEIPAREHPLSEPAVGLTKEQMSVVHACVTKRCRVVVRGEAKVITVAGPYWSYLKCALDTAKGTILSSSDLTRVKVTRKDPKTGKTTEYIVDTIRKWSETGDLWLRDGDVIEVPEKQ